MPGWRVLTSDDPVEMMVLQEALVKARENDERRIHNQAVAIVNILAKAMKGR